MSPQLRKIVQDFLVDYDHVVSRGFKLSDYELMLELSINLLQKAVVEDYKIPEDTNWTYTKPIVGIDDEGQPIVIDSWNNKVSRSINNE